MFHSSVVLRCVEACTHMHAHTHTNILVSTVEQYHIVLTYSCLSSFPLSGWEEPSLDDKCLVAACECRGLCVNRRAFVWTYVLLCVFTISQGHWALYSLHLINIRLPLVTHWLDTASLSAMIPTLQNHPNRSEERRVGKECRSRWSPKH